jgi:hypothetical protein
MVGVVNECRTQRSMYVEERWAREGDGAGPGLSLVCTAACQESGAATQGKGKTGRRGRQGEECGVKRVWSPQRWRAGLQQVGGEKTGLQGAE